MGLDLVDNLELFAYCNSDTSGLCIHKETDKGIVEKRSC